MVGTERGGSTERNDYTNGLFKKSHGSLQKILKVCTYTI